MDFFELDAFLKLSQTLHFAKTAQEVNLSSSALSRLISRLEEETGTALFERNNREVHLTEEGLKFAKFAEKCIGEKEHLLEELAFNDGEVRGVLHVYASVTACYTIMPPFLKKLKEKYPHIQLNIQTGDPAAAVDAVKEGRAELAVAALPEAKLDQFDCISIRQSPLVFAAANPGPYVEVFGSPQDIVSSVPLILPRTGLARSRFDFWVKSRNVTPVIAAETEGNEAVMALAALGLGIGLVPKIVLDYGPYKEGFICHNAGNALGYYDIGFIQRSVFSGNKRQRAVRNAVDEILHLTPRGE